MTKYIEIKGGTVQSVDSDPPATQVGQVWFNTASGTLKGYVPGTGAWSSGGNLGTARVNPGGAGTQTAGIIFAGGPATPSVKDETETYNGTSWSEVSEVNTGRFSNQQGLGTQTAALLVSGYDGTARVTNVESWNGASWSNSTVVNAGRSLGAASGTTTAAFFAGGETPDTDANEIWNGSAWTESSELNTARSAMGRGGTTTAGIIMAGQPGNKNIVETWDGTSWTEETDMNTARRSAAADGNSSYAVVFGGVISPPPRSALTEQWNGSSWTEVGDLATGRGDSASGNSGSGFLTSFAAAGAGSPGSGTDATEEWSAPASVETLTVS